MKCCNMKWANNKHWFNINQILNLISVETTSTIDLTLIHSKSIQHCIYIVYKMLSPRNKNLWIHSLQKNGKTRIHFRYTFVHFLRRCSFFLNWFLLLSCNTRHCVSGHVPCCRKVLWERNEGAVAYFLKSSILGAMFWSFFDQIFSGDYWP